MSSKRPVVLAFAVVSAIATLGDARIAHAGCVEHPAQDLGPRLARLGEPVNLALVGAAVVSPFAIAPTGADWSTRLFYLRDLGGRYEAETTSRVAPYALTGALALGWGLAALEGDCISSRVAARALQAVAIAATLQGALKLVVGREWPAADPARTFVDDGRAYEAHPFTKFGAWPSGHAATTFAFASAIRIVLPRSIGVVRYGGYALALAVSAGMLYSDHHWTSDIVSGALLGEAIGRSVAGGPADAPSRVVVVPTPSGIAVAGLL